MWMVDKAGSSEERLICNLAIQTGQGGSIDPPFFAYVWLIGRGRDFSEFGHMDRVAFDGAFD